MLSKKIQKNFEPGNDDSLAFESRAAIVSNNGSLDDNKRIFYEQVVNDDIIDNVNNDEEIIEKHFSQEDCCTTKSKDEKDASLCSFENKQSEQDETSCPEHLKCVYKSKRHLDRVLDNPKPCKLRKSSSASLLSCKYSKVSFCGIEEHLSYGFYDAGRDRPFMPLETYEQNQYLASCEVILLDRDEELDAIVLTAQALVYNLKQLNGLNRTGNKAEVDNLQLQMASLLALYVSDHFGGSDRGVVVERTWKFVSGSNYSKPFLFVHAQLEAAPV